ncbi:hypothetical protein E3O42_13360 [Cryobacterium adonitolivorans]|uniref:Uncharacterized protein n=1 Tax=Cryobacterium adonitolivorans TaxID=1259189 RepID=A0A4V3IC76_9MICO|nr:hypothetical protein [Cryobacterium adonitolivorans]TFB99538.1 hypothetical protein E3O42_13360 [Cryobacterium adonitolivorans]
MSTSRFVKFALIVRHDDNQREFAYTSGAEKAFGRAAVLGWTVVSITEDWSTVFGVSSAPPR